MRRWLACFLMTSAALYPAAAFAQDAAVYHAEDRSSNISGYSSSACAADDIIRKEKFFGIETNGGMSDRARKDYALNAARAAVGQGYNYAVMEPLVLTEHADYRNVVQYGWGEARKVTKKGALQWRYIQECDAIDDETAFDIMLNPDTKSRLAPKASVVDLRQFIRTFSGSAPDGMRPAIDERRYKLPGDRERYERQYPVKLAAMQCRTDLAPSSLQNFRSANGHSRACLEGLRGRAQAVGWTEFPLAVADKKAALNTGGYTLRGTPGAKKPAAAAGAKPTMPAQMWGEGWTDLTQDFAGLSGKVFTDGKIYVLASNTMDGKPLIDYGVYSAAKEILRESRNALTLKDLTPEYRKRLEKKRDSMRKKQSEAAARDARDALRDADASPRDNERAERNLAETEADLARARNEPIEEVDLSEMEAMMKGFPSTNFDIDAMRAQMREAMVLGKASEIKALEQRAEQLRGELTAKRSAAASVGGGSSAVYAQAPAALPLHAVSESYKNRDRGIYRAMELYRNIYVLEYTGMSYCYDGDLVCTDKLQAYAALGPRLEGSNYQPVSTPTGYKPFEP